MKKVKAIKNPCAKHYSLKFDHQIIELISDFQEFFEADEVKENIWSLLIAGISCENMATVDSKDKANMVYTCKLLMNLVDRIYSLQPPDVHNTKEH